MSKSLALCSEQNGNGTQITQMKQICWIEIRKKRINRNIQDTQYKNLYLVSCILFIS